MDMNKVWLSGVAMTQPILTKLGSKTPFSSFTLKVNETFRDKDGKKRTKENFIEIESLGRGAQSAVEKVEKNMRYVVDGYLRQDNSDGVNRLRVRSFALYSDDSEAASCQRDGLKKALDVLYKSMDVASAKKTLEDLINNH